MEIKRDYYLNKLISKQNNGLIKIVTGIRRCGKSYLLDPMFKNYLLSNGVKEDHIIKIDLDIREKDDKKKLEIDFIVNKGYDRYYIQSALNMDSDDKKIQELRPLLNVNDFFKKIIVVNSDIPKYKNENGILIIGIYDFLLNKDSLEY